MLPRSPWFFLFLRLFSSLVGAQGPLQTLFPAAIPLAVKTPYMNMWYGSVNGSGPLSNNWPQFWNKASLPSFHRATVARTEAIGGWGHDDTGAAANVTNIQITPTRSIFVMQAGPMNFTVTFLSPVEPDDWVKQSIPFSYVSVEAHSLDGNSHPVQLYSAITALQLASGNRSSQVQWSNVDTNTGNTIYHEIQLRDPQQNAEELDQAQDGTVYVAMSTWQTGISWQIDLVDNAHEAFQANGILGNSESTAFGPISPNEMSFAYAVDLGTIRSTTSPVTWSVGYVRDPSITYTTAAGAMQQRRPYYVTQYTRINDAIDAFTGDYAGAHDRAVALDSKIMNAAARISSQYSDIVSLATRQTMSALDFTVGTDSSGHPIPGDVKIFMKNLGTDRRVNPVEHLFAAFPMFLYLNASIGGALLQPLLESQINSTSVPYAAQDLGSRYPNVSNPNAVSLEGVEQSGNMLIMELAHARLSGDGTLLSQYYNTTKRWADYLVSNALEFGSQTNNDGGSTGSLNIALKGIIGVRAMAEIAHAVGEVFDAMHYSNQSLALLSSWLSLATSSSGSRLLGNYGDEQSWSLMYNLFADKMLGLDFVPQSVINLQTQYLSSLLANASKWGLPIDSTPGQNANAAWSLFASAFVSDTSVRDNLIKGIYNHANFNQSAGAFPERYSVTDNGATNGQASPALGGLFSHLVLTVPNKTISIDSPSAPGGSGGERYGGSWRKVGTIVGCAIGGLSTIGMAVFFVIVLKRRRQRRGKTGKTEAVEQVPHPRYSPWQMQDSYAQSSVTGCSMQRFRGARKDFSDVLVLPRHVTTTPFGRIRTGDAGTSQGSTSTNMADAGESLGPVLSIAPDPAYWKLREVLFRRTQRNAPFESVVTPPDISSQIGSVSNGPGDTSLMPGGSRSGSSTDTAGLCMELQNLRQIVRDIRTEREEPPPAYIA